MYNKSILNDIRDRVSIVSYIGERIPLKKAGRNFKGACPFHNEKTPSFNVSDDKQIYHCFGCGAGGDIFDFVMKFESQDFPEAVRHLASLAGVELPKMENPEDRSEEEARARKKRWFFRINEIARDFYASRLADPIGGKVAHEYLQHRGILGEFLTQHFLGYADNMWDSLAKHLEQSNVPLDMAAEVGLIRKRDTSGYYDFFRDRIMFPITSPRGEIVGFGGRALGEEEQAKYMNSPDSLVYHKSSCVYGLDTAPKAIRESGFVILVEGYMDALALMQAGIGNVVAPLGTALTEGHLKLVSRYSKDIVLIFDGDEAGAKAATRTLELFIEFGIMPRVVVLPDGEDPDSMVRREGRDAFLERLTKAVSLFEFFVDRVVREKGFDSAGKVASMEQIIPVLRQMNDPVGQGVYMRLASSRLGLEESDVRRAVGQKGRTPPSMTAKPKPSVDMSSKTGIAAERALMKALIANPSFAKEVFEKLSLQDFRDEWCAAVAKVFAGELIDTGEVNIGHLIANMGDQEMANQIRSLALVGSEEDDEIKDLVDDCVNAIGKRPTLERLQSINDDIKRAELDGDEEKLVGLLKEMGELAQRKHG